MNSLLYRDKSTDGPPITDVPVKWRNAILKSAIGRLRDKSSNVRKNAIRLLIRFIETAPFVGPTADGGKLSLKLFSSRLEQLEELVKVS
jgi:hypothetical protein